MGPPVVAGVGVGGDPLVGDPANQGDDLGPAGRLRGGAAVLRRVVPGRPDGGSEGQEWRLLMGQNLTLFHCGWDKPLLCSRSEILSAGILTASLVCRQTSEKTLRYAGGTAESTAPEDQGHPPMRKKVLSPRSPQRAPLWSPAPSAIRPPPPPAPNRPAAACPAGAGHLHPPGCRRQPRPTGLHPGQGAGRRAAVDQRLQPGEEQQLRLAEPDADPACGGRVRPVLAARTTVARTSVRTRSRRTPTP